MRFPIKVKVGLYAALVSVIALALMPVIMSTYIYHRQLVDLDAELTRSEERRVGKECA